MALNAIDVHTHFFPRGLSNFAERTGDQRWPSLEVDQSGGRIMRGRSVFRPVQDTCWDLERRVERMDATGVETQVLSPVPVCLTTWADHAEAASFARSHNEGFAQAVADGPPGRFAWIGTVPLQRVDSAIAELEYGVHELGMCGVEIGTEVGGLELDECELEAFFSAAASLDVPIFMHPTDGKGAVRREGIPYEFAIGMLTDTTLAVTAVLLSGVVEANPSLRLGVAHGCGTFPWALPRIQRGATLGSPSGPESRPFVSEGFLDLVSHLWADTLVFDPAMLPLLLARFGEEHLLLGSDFPFYPPSFGDPIAMLHAGAAEGHCTSAHVSEITTTNAVNFLGADPRARITPEPDAQVDVRDSQQVFRRKETHG